jgi:hypothetical protein
MMGFYLSAREIGHDEVSTISWDSVPGVSAEEVFRFREKESHQSYHTAHKNCKHLAYDFLSQVVQREDLGDFFRLVWSTGSHLATAAALAINF